MIGNAAGGAVAAELETSTVTNDYYDQGIAEAEEIAFTDLELPHAGVEIPTAGYGYSDVSINPDFHADLANYGKYQLTEMNRTNLASQSVNERAIPLSVDYCSTQVRELFDVANGNYCPVPTTQKEQGTYFKLLKAFGRGAVNGIINLRNLPKNIYEEFKDRPFDLTYHATKRLAGVLDTAMDVATANDESKMEFSGEVIGPTALGGGVGLVSRYGFMVRPKVLPNVVGGEGSRRANIK